VICPAVHSRTVGLMSLPVSKFLESLARQVLELQVNLNSVCRNGPRLSLSPLQTELQRLAVSQTCLKSSEDKGIIDARKGTHSPRLVVSQACLIIDDIPDKSFMDMLVTSQPLDPQADGLEGADHGGDVQVCDEMGEGKPGADCKTACGCGATVRVRHLTPPPPRRPHLRGATEARRRRRGGSRGAPPRSRAWGRSRGQAQRRLQDRVRLRCDCEGP